MKKERIASVKDLTGMKFGYLTVLEYTPERKNASVVWLCQCICGKVIKLNSSRLMQRDTKSCGCKKSELLTKANTKHGMCKTLTYSKWRGMFQRCENEKSSEYFRYGARGIKVCKRWSSFINFLEDMDECPKGLSLDRIDPDGDYEPSNCRWATPNEQSYNQRLSKRNTSGVAGVRWDEKLKKWRVRILKNNVLLHDKHYENFEEAVMVRRELEERYYGHKK